MDEKNTHTLTVTDQKKMCVTGVDEVDGVTSERVIFTLFGKKRLVITGNSLKMSGFSKQSGTLYIDGNICDIKYAGDKTGILKKLIK